MAITARFEADFSQFTAAVKSADTSLESLTTSAKTVGTALMASLAASDLRQFGHDAKEAAKEFIDAFAEEQAAVNNLTVALQAQGTFTPELAKQYKELGEEFQRTTTFSDDTMFSMMALMVQVGGVMPAQMKGALLAAANLSAGLGIDLHAATLALAKGFEGGTTALLKMVPSLKSVIKEGATMSEVVGIINERFGGQAVGQLNTYTGATKQLANQIDDFKEKIGELLVNGLTPLLNTFQGLPDSVKTAIIAVVAIGTAIAPLAISLGALTPLVIALAGAFGTGLVAALGGLAPFLGVAGIIAAGFAAWFVVFQNLDVFIWAAKRGWDMLTDTFRSAASSITNAAQSTYEGVYNWLVTRFQGIVDWVNQKIQSIIAAFQGMYAMVSGGSIVPDMVSDIADEFRKLDHVMVQPVMRATTQATSGFEDLSAAAPTARGAGGLAFATGGGGGAVVYNTFNIVDTEANLVRRISDGITRSLKSQMKLSTA